MEKVICKFCGATLSVPSGAAEVACEYCGTKQTFFATDRKQEKTNPLDQQIKDYDQLSLFGNLCRKAMSENEEKQRRIQKLKGELNLKYTDHQDAVRKEYQAVAELEANADEKILSGRFVACLVVAVLFVATVLVNASWILWGGIGAVAVLLFFFRPGYARKRKKHYEEMAYKKVINNPEYKNKMNKAFAEDEKQTKLHFERVREEIRRLEDRENGSGWLYEELHKSVMEIRREAQVKGFSQFMNQTDTSIVDVLANKMGGAIHYKEFPVTYRQAIQKGKVQAINDWIECARSLSNIEDMLGQLFK